MKLSFQTIVLFVFGFFILFGVAVFGGYVKLGSSKVTTPTGTVFMWGTMDLQSMSQFIAETTVQNQTFSIIYVQKNPATYESDLVEAFASGTGPDLFMVTPDIFWRQRDKMYEIPYASYPVTTYTLTYMDIANTYLTQTGVLAQPLFVDPLVGFWNKDIFASVGIATAPKEWKEFPELAKKISIVSNDFNITRSAVALGEYTNIRHAKEILSLLFLQAGDPIMHVNGNGKLVLDLGTQGTSTQSAASVALDYYTQFANPSNRTIYSWNKTFSSDRDRFLSGDLAYYVGLGSELSSLRRTNPNLNFDIAPIPQANANGTKSTVGQLYGVAISKQSKNTGLAYYVAKDMTVPLKAATLLSTLSKTGYTVAPVRRDMVPNDPTNTYYPLLYQSALISKAWIDPNTSFTDSVFQAMVSDIQSGKSNSTGALNTASSKINAYLTSEQ